VLELKLELLLTVFVDVLTAVDGIIPQFFAKARNLALDVEATGSDSSNVNELICVNCKGPHHPFDVSCLIFLKYKIINTIMAYCNINQYKVKRLIRVRNIENLEQTELVFKASAYYAWFSEPYI